MPTSLEKDFRLPVCQRLNHGTKTPAGIVPVTVPTPLPAGWRRGLPDRGAAESRGTRRIVRTGGDRCARGSRPFPRPFELGRDTTWKGEGDQKQGEGQKNRAHGRNSGGCLSCITLGAAGSEDRGKEPSEICPRPQNAGLRAGGAGSTPRGAPLTWMNEVR